MKKQNRIVNDTKSISTANLDNNIYSLFQDFSISFNYGYTQFDGDIRQYDYSSSVQTGLSYQDSDFKELRSAFSFSLEKKMNEKISYNLEYVTGKFAGLRRPNEYVGFETDDPYGTIAESSVPNGQKFVTSFNEIDMLLNYNLNSDISKLIITEMPKNLSIIAKAGFGVSQFRSLRTNLYSDDYIYSFGYEELTKNKSDFISESVMVFGCKIKYEVIGGLSLLADYTLRVTNSDKWDSSIMNSDNGKDKFSLFSLGLSYDLSHESNTSKD
tara:strand:+ start:85 stop:894 length:810 start_codon:yes stop_codon:yes gene_type:complete